MSYDLKVQVLINPYDQPVFDGLLSANAPLHSEFLDDMPNMEMSDLLGITLVSIFGRVS